MTIVPKVTTKEQFSNVQNTPEYKMAVQQFLANKLGQGGGSYTPTSSPTPTSTPMGSYTSTNPISLESNALGYLGGDKYKSLEDRFLAAKENGQSVADIQAEASKDMDKLGVNSLTGQNLNPVKSMNEYTEDARQQFEPTYNQRVQLLKNQLAQNVTNLQNSKVGINQNFDQQIAKNNRYIKGNQNKFSNMVLGRGLGRSTIATSGIGEMSNIGARMNDETNFKRGQELGNIDNKIATEQNNMNNRLGQMELDKQDQIAALAKQMMKEDKEEQWKQRLHQDEMYTHKLDMNHRELMQDKQFSHDFDVKNMEHDFAKEMEQTKQNFQKEMEHDRQGFEKELQQSKNDFMREMKNLDISEAEKERKWKEIQAQKERDFQATQNEKQRANQLQLTKMQIAAQKSMRSSFSGGSRGGGGYYRSYSGGRRYYSGGRSGGGRFDEAGELMKMYLNAESSLGHLPAAKPQVTKDILVYKNPKPGTPLAPWAKTTSQPYSLLKPGFGLRFGNYK